MSKESSSRVFGSLLDYLLLAVVLIFIVVALAGGFYLFYVESSPSVYTFLGGVALVVAGVFMKFFFDLLMVKKKERKEEVKVLKNLLMECEGNLELIENKKIRWPQVHFDVISYRIVREKTMLSGFSSELSEPIAEAYQLISEIEKRKLRAFDETTDVMLVKLSKALPKVIEKLKEKISS